MALETIKNSLVIEKNINLEQVVPPDRDFWVCSHCRPAQKFTDRAQYIAHHFSHE